MPLEYAQEIRCTDAFGPCLRPVACAPLPATRCLRPVACDPVPALHCLRHVPVPHDASCDSAAVDSNSNAKMNRQFLVELLPLRVRACVRPCARLHVCAHARVPAYMRACACMHAFMLLQSCCNHVTPFFRNHCTNTVQSHRTVSYHHSAAPRSNHFFYKYFCKQSSSPS